MKKNITLKLLLFFATSINTVFSQSIVAGDTVSSAIIYDNIKDTILPYSYNGSSIYDLDVDNDNTNDISFSFTHQGAAGNFQIWKKVSSLISVEFVCDQSNTNADTIGFNTVINSSLNWQNLAAGVILRYAHTSGFPPATTGSGLFVNENKYLAFRKISTTDTLYGWIFLDNMNAFMIKSYAVENNAVRIEGIFPGKNQGTIFPNPSDKIVNIDFKESVNIKGFEIWNSEGKLIQKEEKDISTTTFNLNTENWREGFYYINIKLERGILKRKIVIQK